MVAELYLQAEVVGCPTVCRHFWAQGVPYKGMPVGDVAQVLEQPHTFCDERGLGFGAYPMHELAAHPQAAEVLRLFADHVGAAELTTGGSPPGLYMRLERQDRRFGRNRSRACQAASRPCSRSRSWVPRVPTVHPMASAGTRNQHQTRTR